jgi:hypothetical protein
MQRATEFEAREHQRTHFPESTASTALFWGLWLFPFGLLVVRSGFVPRVLGALLLVAGVAYLVSSFTALMVPEYAAPFAQWTMPFKMGELPMVVWLVVWGARELPSPLPVTTGSD